MMQEGLHEGWEWRRLGELVTIQNERLQDAADDAPAKQLIETDSIDGEQGEISMERMAPFRVADDGRKKAKIVRKHDVVIALTRLRQRKVAVIPAALDNHVCSADVCVLRPKPNVAAAYVWLVCRSFMVSRHLKGSVIPRLSVKDLMDVRVPVPWPDDADRSLMLQRDSVARAKGLLGRLHHARRLQRSIVEDTDRLLPVMLAATFPPGVPRGWRLVELRKLIHDDFRGGYLQAKARRNKREKPAAEVRVRLLQTADIAGGDPRWDDEEKRIVVDAADVPALALRDRDILVAILGAHLGKSLLVREPPPNSIFQNSIFRMRARDVPPEYLYWFLQSVRCLRQIKTAELGVANKFIRHESILSLEVPVPSDTGEQLRIVQRCELADAALRRMRALSDESARSLDELDNALSQRVFGGRA